MLGKQVSQEELQDVLKAREALNELDTQLKAELARIKKGECLRYECKVGGELIQHLALQSLIVKIKGLKMVAKDSYEYVYREE